MIEYIESLIEFSKISNSDSFISEEKQISNSIQNILAEVYLNDGDEIQLVEKTIEALNVSRSHHIKLESMFIHGNRSQIKFQYYGKSAQKELGDLILVSTLTRRGKPILQKLTIIQAKRDTTKPGSWGIDKEQLFFLSNWPIFSGVKGIFPKKNLTIPDFSGCLGSYYLYREPGDIVFISARELENLLGSKKRISLDDIMKSYTENSKHQNNSFGFSPLTGLHPKELYHLSREYFYIMEELGHFPHPYMTYTGNNLPILQNVCICKNIFDGIRNFARLNIGEPVFSKDAVIQVNEFGYRMLNTIIRYISRKEQGRLGQLMSFNSDAPYFQELNMEGISVGIVHTITEVSPG